MGSGVRTQRDMDLRLDADGHLADAAAWCEDVARRFAEEAAIPLGAEHWQVIRAVRSFHAETGVAPSMRALVKLLRGQAPALASSMALLRLFPGNSANVVAKLAGLPRPDRCL